MTRRYKAFVSYSWADKEWGQWLHRSLELYRTPKALVGRETPLGPAPTTLQPIFKDREEEAAGGGVGAAIEAALEASDFLIVICSPRSAQSTWVNREVAWFKTHKDKSRVLALIVDGEPGASSKPGREAEECFPRTLTHKVASDLQPTDEAEDAPLAADARPEGDGKRGAKLKLAAALLGVGLDDLVRRDERRRTIRRRFVTGAAFGLAAVLGGLSIFAFNQRDAAVTARDDAETLIEEILTDFKDDLKDFGTLKSVTKLGNRAIGYYEGQDVKALTPDQLGRRARVLLMLGEADNERGDLTAALARYQTAAATTKEQLARDPENPQRMFDHAQSVFWVGYIAWQRGDRAKAKRQFTEYHDLAQRLVATDPANEDWQIELNYAHSNLGTLAMDTGESAEAEGWFRKSLDIAVRLLAKNPNDIGRVITAGESNAWLADSLYRQLKISDAANARRDQMEIYSRGSSIGRSAQIQSSALSANYNLALIAITTNQITEAIKWASIAKSVAEELVANEPESVERRNELAFAYATLAEAHFYQGERREARDLLGSSISLGEKLSSQEGGLAGWRNVTIIQPKLVLARLEAIEGNVASAVGLYTEVASYADSILLTNRSDPVLARRYCMALAGRARLSNDFNNAWAEIVSILGANEKKHGPEALGLLAEAYQRIGEAEKARATAARLYDAGYRHPEFVALLEEFPGLKAAARSDRVH